MNKGINLDTKQKIRVGLVQINNSFSNQNYFPYSIALLQAYAQKYLTNMRKFEFLLPLYKRISVESAVEKLSVADIIFFSTYVWNTRISLEIAKRVKQSKPGILIVFGGPQVPDKGGEDFLHLNHFVDIVCHGEGELPFLAILENFISRDWNNVLSISYIDSQGKLIQTPRNMRITDLDTIPSPYLTGVFDPLMDENSREEWVALWETNRGCPFLCAYCDWGSAVKSTIYVYGIERLFMEIDWFSKHKIEFVVCCDANFGILPRDIKIVDHFAKNKMKYFYPNALSVQSTKNSTERSYTVSKIMADAGLNKGVALSLQSLNTDTLQHVNRANISIKTFQELQKRFAADNIETFTDLILGLPCETYETFVYGASSVIESGQHNRIQFNNLSILPNAEMGNPEYQKRHGYIIVESKVINAHGSLTDREEIYETQQLVVGTNAMPKGDWLRARVFSWMTGLLHFDKLLQIPFILLHKTFSISFRTLIEIFTDVDGSYPIISEIRTFFFEKAVDIQNGGSEFCESREWLNLWWPADELILIRLCTENKLTHFYEEAERLIINLLQKEKANEYQSILHDAIFLNHNLIKMPFQKEDLHLILSHNIWEVYESALKGSSIQIKSGIYRHTIDKTSTRWLSWEDWCRQVIWYGHKKGAYLYKFN